MPFQKIKLTLKLINKSVKDYFYFLLNILSYFSNSTKNYTRTIFYQTSMLRSIRCPEKYELRFEGRSSFSYLDYEIV